MSLDQKATSEVTKEPKLIDQARVLELFSGIGGMHYALIGTFFLFWLFLRPERTFREFARTK